MKELRDKVAVVTGAASGIGRALAERFAAEGMKVVLADLEAEPLARVEAALREKGATVLGVPTDVSSGAAVEALAARTREAFGAAHVVCNNAGVGGGGGLSWKLTEKDWDWTLGVNLWGVIHGIRAFVPQMVEAGEGHVLNTASIAGLLAPAFMAPYVATKHAVVAMSEVLARDLQAVGSKVGVSVLCPGFVRTGIGESQRNRPAHLRDARGEGGPDPARQMLEQGIRDLVANGIEPAVVADHVVTAIREERFYVLPHPELKAAVRARMDDILGDRTPRFDPNLFSKH